MKNLVSLIKLDMIAYDTKLANKEIGVTDFLYRYFKTPGFQCTTWMRFCKYIEPKKTCKFLYLISRIKYRNLQVKYGIQAGHRLRVGGGITIHHYNGIVIGEGASIGANFNIRNNVTIGRSNNKLPVIGNNVIVGAGAIIIGGITIGDNCTIGAGSVVTKSFENGSIIAGNPAKLIGYNSIENMKF